MPNGVTVTALNAAEANAAAETEAGKAAAIIFEKVGRHLSGRDGLNELAVDPNFRADSAKLLGEWCAAMLIKLKS